MSGALAVKERLLTRGLQVNSACGRCNEGPESIVHVIFNCPVAKEVWENSGIPLTPAGFSPNSIFLNLHYLLDCSKKEALPKEKRWFFPWILWNLWKSRNALLFENTSYTSANILEKAKEEAEIWLAVNNFIENSGIEPNTPQPPRCWQKPLANTIKCNIRASWLASDKSCRVSWLVRDQCGKTLLHGRRSFVYVRSLHEAELLGLLWATESMANLKMDRVVFEASFEKAREVILNPNTYPCFQNYVG